MQATETISPEEFTQQIAVALPYSTPTESARLLEHAWAWATLFYGGTLPQSLADRLNEMEGMCPDWMV